MRLNRSAHLLLVLGFAVIFALFAALPTVKADKFSVEEFLTNGIVPDSKPFSDGFNFGLNDLLPSFRTTAELSFTTLVDLNKGQVFAMILPGYSVGASSASLYVDDAVQFSRRSVGRDGGSLLDIFGLADALRLYVEVPRRIVAGSHIRIVIHDVLTPPWHFLSPACRDILKNPTDFTSSNASCCDSIKLGVLSSLQGSFIFSLIEASTCTVPGGGPIPPPIDQCKTNFIPSICCQYSQYADVANGIITDDRCLEYFCLESNILREYRPNLPYNTQCCQYQDVEDYTLHPQCPACTPGNFDSNACCLPGSADRENNQFCDRVVCNCDEWTPERCCYGFLDSPYRIDDLCLTCADPAYFEENREDCCAEETTQTARCLCEAGTFLTNFCCTLPQFTDDERCRDACDFDDFCPDVCCPIFNENPLCVDLCEEEPCLCDPSGPGCGCAGSIYHSHELNVSDVRSGGNTVIINHLTVNAYIDGGSGEGGEGVLPLVLLNVESGNGGITPPNPDPVDPDPKPGEEIDPTTGLPVRMICRLLRPITLTPPEMVIFKALYMTTLKLRWPDKIFYVTIHRQYFVKGNLLPNLPDIIPKVVDASPGIAELVVVTQVTSPQYGQTDLAGILKEVSSVIRDDAKSQLGATGVNFDEPFAVAEAQVDECAGICGGKEECPQCELGHNCKEDVDCLSGFCVKEVCAAGRDSGSSFANTKMSHAIAIFGAVAMALLAIMQFNQ